VSPPVSALTWEPSIAASSMSSSPALRSSASRISCSCGHRPASVQSRNRRQAVTPLQPTCSAGTSRQLAPLAARRRSRAGRPGRPPATVPDNGDDAAGEEEATGPRGPTGHQVQDHPDTRRSLPPARPTAKPFTKLILKRSVRRRAPCRPQDDEGARGAPGPRPGTRPRLGTGHARTSDGRGMFGPTRGRGSLPRVRAGRPPRPRQPVARLPGRSPEVPIAPGIQLGKGREFHLFRTRWKHFFMKLLSAYESVFAYFVT